MLLFFAFLALIFGSPSWAVFWIILHLADRK